MATFISAGSTWRLRHRLKDTSAAPPVPLGRIFIELKEVLANQSFRILALTVIVFWVAQGTHGSLGVHAYRHFWTLDAGLIRDVLYANTAGLALGIPLCAMLLKRFEKKQICAGAIAAFCVGQFVPPALALSGVIQMSVAVTYPLLSASAFVLGLAMTCVAITFGSMMADATDEHELRFGTRREGLYFSGLTFGGKCAIGLGSFVAGVALDLIGFPTDLAGNPDQRISPETIRNLGMIYGPGAAIISFASASILLRHRLDGAEHRRIQSELTRRAAPVPPHEPAGPPPAHLTPGAGTK
jgi:GPH family glycoside/pentoside/hexuronide:cation symporter